MTDSDFPAAPTPRKKADVWAREKATEPWELAAARIAHAWPPAQLMAEDEFDKAIARIRAIEFG
jgi:hypothetical protein